MEWQQEMEDEIRNLEEIQYTIDEKDITIKSEVYQTMHDGKNRNAIYGTLLQQFADRGKLMKKHGDAFKIDFQTCWVCMQHPDTYNSTDVKVFRSVKEWVEAIVGFGCNPLHLKMGVVKELRTASVEKKISREEEVRREAGNENYTAKQIEKRRNFWKRDYQEGFIRNLNGLKVGFPDRKGGSTDRGNTADRILLRAKVSAKVLGIKSRLIVVIRKLIVMLNATHTMTDINEYKRLGQKGHQLYLKIFGKHRIMGAALHFVFHHAHLYLEWAAEKGFPLGALSECSVEDDNQFRRYLDNNHSRWTGTKEKLEDMMVGTCWR